MATIKRSLNPRGGITGGNATREVAGGNDASLLPVISLVAMNLRHMQCFLVLGAVCVPLDYLQRLEEAKGAQSSAAGHQTEGGVVEHFFVVISVETHTHTHTSVD